MGAWIRQLEILPIDPVINLNQSKLEMLEKSLSLDRPLEMKMSGSQVAHSYRLAGLAGSLSCNSARRVLMKHKKRKLGAIERLEAAFGVQLKVRIFQRLKSFFLEAQKEFAIE